jgi:hypothetical protein
LRLALYKGPNKVDVSFLSPEDGNISHFRKAVFSGYVEYLTIDKVHNRGEYECYAPYSEPLGSTWLYFISELVGL